MTFEELERWRENACRELALRLGQAAQGNGADQPIKREVLICAGGACVSCGHQRIVDKFKVHTGRRRLDEHVKIVETGCVGCCDLGVVVQVMPDNVLYARVEEKDADRIIDDHLIGGKVVEDLLPREGDTLPFQHPEEMPFFAKQVKIVLENSGLIDPLSISEYIARDGYAALAKVLGEMVPEGVVQEVTDSGLRGRGGGGFSVGRKWGMLASAPGPEKYVICNGDEGDPGAFMDRSVLESDPHRVLEGMIIAGYATAARHGVLYVRAEYPLAIHRLQVAIDAARQHGILGQRVLGTDFGFDVEIRVGAGAFVCGEETALIASVEGRRGQPRPRPPYPTQSGLGGCPSMINNVESLANIPTILRKGAAWFRTIGTENSPGTKVFALAGAIANTGLVEVPMGMSLRELVYDVGGGVLNGREFKAAQTGGPSGGCIPAEHLDTPLDFDSLQKLGSIMGSGGLIVMDDTNCMVDVARFFMDFCVDESCGKCPPCRVGTKELHHVLTKITEGKATDKDLAQLETLSAVVSTASLCGLGMTAPNPVLSTMRFFRNEYEAHIHDKRCPSGVCAKLLTFSILEEACTGCSLCAKNCPVEAIHKFDDRRKYWVDTETCIHCNECFDVCRFEAVLKE